MTLDIAIVGGGIVGGSFACALAGSGLRAALIEPRPPAGLPASGFDARVYALSLRSREFLERCGVWRYLDEDRVAPVREMQVHGDGGARLGFDAYRNGLPELAAIVEEGNLQQAIRRALADGEEVRLAGDAGCEHIEWRADLAQLALSDGSRIEARLVVGADGAESKVRAAAGIGVRRRDYGQQGVVANFLADRPHGDVARQWFRDDGVLALLPLPMGQVSMVWSTGDEHAAELLALAPAELCDRVARASAHCLGELRATGPARAFPLRRMRADALIGARLALVGDAAHNVHPLAGQGLNLGLADAEALAGVLRGRGVRRDCGARALLRDYERARKEDILAMEYVTDGLQSLFASRLPGAAALRNAGLALTDRLPPLKRYLVKRALG
ncbi:MAG TPA: UbiH/UbiF family hydroxylase [Burkholderiales bacterium]|nr:UbiH/UbiF family hydroxylase [Burkholderiales bacterium]